MEIMEDTCGENERGDGRECFNDGNYDNKV